VQFPHEDGRREKDRDKQLRTRNVLRLERSVVLVARKAGEWDVPVSEQECRCSFGRIEARRWSQSVIACPRPVRGYNCSAAAYSENSARQPIENRAGRMVVGIVVVPSWW
jgi:hypothetical protein